MFMKLGIMGGNSKLFIRLQESPVILKVAINVSLNLFLQKSRTINVLSQPNYRHSKSVTECNTDASIYPSTGEQNLSLSFKVSP